MDTENWNSIETLDEWNGFAWFGLLKFKHKRTGETVVTKASGIYGDNAREIRFKLEEWPETENLKNYELTHYITRPDKIRKAFTEPDDLL